MLDNCVSDIRHKLRKNLLFVLLADALLFTISYWGSYYLRFDLRFSHIQYFNFKNTLFPIVLIKILIFSYYGLYRGVWRYTGLRDLGNIIKASIVSSLSIILLIRITYGFQGIARSVFLIDSFLTVYLIGGFRLMLRIALVQGKQGKIIWRKSNHDAGRKRKVLIIGAGDAGEMILREINNNPALGYTVVGFLDDDPDKINRFIHGVKVLGNIQRITSLVKDIDLSEIIIAIPSASEEKMRSMVTCCQKTGIQCKIIPGFGELMNGKVHLSAIRDISYADLLGRNQVELDMDRIGAYLSGKCVLVTGAGGSIGSECCRQIARYKPKNLIMLDRAESSLYDIEMELKDIFPKQGLVPVLGSITCLPRLKRIFEQFEPQVVFHAAAYKHVPMMEMHPWEGVYNNILGTKNLLDVALKAGVEQFVLISTDKAVRPTNVMGACKRVAEIILQLKYKEAAIAGVPLQSKIMAVRFGNVIGSAGSVVPLFKKQIARGGPLTITHPEVIRYFMTINEAVQLVLQAGAIGKSGEIYILKMGKPIKIIDMARDLIRLYGFDPDRDIKINITGLRPGEKLYEELITEGEHIVATPHERLMVLKGNGSNGMMYRDLEEKIEELLSAADRGDTAGIKSLLKEIVPEYNPQTGKESTNPINEQVIGAVNEKTRREMVLQYS
ncbi:MAG: nucleoside-diphosphate sugar epimerase/dehydratase [bacterium]